MANIIDLGPVMLIPKGVWDAEITYERLNVVRHGSAAWVCKVETSTGIEPSEDSTDWLILVKDISSVTSVNGQRGDVVIELTETETPPANDNSNRVATTEWVTDKIEALDTDTISTDVEALKKSMLNVEGAANTAVNTANGKVSKTGDTMTGALNVRSGVNFSSYSLVHPPAQDSWGQSAIQFYDANNIRVGFIQPFYRADGKVELRFAVSSDGETNRYLNIYSDGNALWDGKVITTFTSNNRIQFPNGTQIWVE